MQAKHWKLISSVYLVEGIGRLVSSTYPGRLLCLFDIGFYQPHGPLTLPLPQSSTASAGCSSGGGTCLTFQAKLVMQPWGAPRRDKAEHRSALERRSRWATLKYTPLLRATSCIQTHCHSLQLQLHDAASPPHSSTPISICIAIRQPFSSYQSDITSTASLFRSIRCNSTPTAVS
jgi:hypothetical protein